MRRNRVADSNEVLAVFAPTLDKDALPARLNTEGPLKLEREWSQAAAPVPVDQLDEEEEEQEEYNAPWATSGSALDMGGVHINKEHGVSMVELSEQPARMSQMPPPPQGKLFGALWQIWLQEQGRLRAP